MEEVFKMTKEGRKEKRIRRSILKQAFIIYRYW